ncbi:D-alanyl-D-alanine carboxypeptidase/D-alanyl-D-alanine-endopeptidase [Streptomyces sp. NPDC086787]|uniref:D-alanyl-D-alanine carboxypeptidase/D-alanyl-D-alanine endopeptidase n=1 Tax=Streptomyces sp. NPDC086787 TaxID=3365759 RepID=UPI0038029FB9
MVVPELKPWRAAVPHVQRIAGAVRPCLARLAAVARTSGSRPVKTWQFSAGAALAGLALASGVAATAGPWEGNGQRTAERERAAGQEGSGGADHADGRAARHEGPRPAPSAVPVLTGLDGAAQTVITKNDPPGEQPLADVLAPLLDVPELGGSHTAAVVDVATGRRLYDAGGATARTPASTTKIATAVAALSALGPDHRLTTRAALEPDTRELVLVGGGDPTLTAHRTTGGWAGLRALADRTAAALKKRGIRQVTLSYDTTLYTGPALHPIGVNDNIAPVSALMADEGRTDGSTSGPVTRVADPAADATAKFAGFLADSGIRTTAPGPSKATKRSITLASVSSPPLSALVERMLTNSDNDIAEALARHTALASGERASFEGGGRAIGARLRKLGLPTAGASFRDGSGLDRADRLTADLLTSLLGEAGSARRPGLRPVLTGLPVAGFTGTLAARYTDGAAGVVRAKTGTLTGVNTLAGTVVDKHGRLLAFAFLASDTTSPLDAQAALDRAATALADW